MGDWMIRDIAVFLNDMITIICTDACGEEGV